MKKCLFITTQFPYPLDNGGKIGSFNGLSVVSGECETTVLSFTEEPQYIDEGIQFYKNKIANVTFEYPVVHDIHIRRKIFKLLKVMANSYIKNVPYVSAKFEDKIMFEKIDEQFKRDFIWDIVFIDYLNMAMYEKYIQKKYKDKYRLLILKDHNVEYEIVKQAADTAKGTKKFILTNEWKRTLKYESYSISNADLAFSVCDGNTEFLRKYNKHAYTMLPTYDILPNRNRRTLNHHILYMGNLSWGANMDGLRWFVDEVLPIVKSKIHDVCLTVVGSGSVRNPFFGNESVNYIGYVKDISHIYDDQSVFIVPLFEGSGIRIKILEAFNNEIAVVSTTLGCGTIGVKNGEEILIANDASTFANNVELLLSNWTLNMSMVKKAKKFLEENYTLDSRREEFKKIVSEKI